MRPADSLGRRIVVAFILFGTVLSLFFAVIAVTAVEGVETYLVENRLTEVAKWALPRDAVQLPVDLPAGLRFHRGDAMPISLRNLRPGVSDITIDGVGLHVLYGVDSAGPYVVVDHESDYEKVELVVYSMFSAFFAGFLVLAGALGSFVARRIVTPIGQLASAVATGETSLPLTERRDELGILARALEAHTAELRAFLDRERFFTGDVSHELRSPLTVILGSAEILLENATSKEVRAPAARIYRAAREAAECVNVLLLLARAPDLSKLPALAVEHIAERETERYRSLVADKEVVLNFAGGANFAVHAPAELCAAAIGNLVRNACQYTERGEVRVTLATGQVIVEDTGPGLPGEVIRTLEQQSGAVPSSGSAGTGLGLSLARRICEYLGARLDYTRREEGGSRFTISFPSIAASS